MMQPATSVVHSMCAELSMARMVAHLYLWLGLPLMLVARVTLSLGGFRLLLAAGLAHIALLLLASRAVSWRESPTGEQCATHVFLVVGPALFVLGAATGAPSPAFPASYAWNTLGLLLGSVVTFAGLMAVAVRLWRSGECLIASLGIGAALLAAAMWLPSLALRVAVLATGASDAWAAEEVLYTHFRTSNAPFTLHTDSWRAVLLMWTYVLSTLHKILLFGVIALFCIGLQRGGFVSRASARVLGGLAAALALLIVFGRLFLDAPAMQVAWGISSIPFVTYIPPYFLGIAMQPRRM
jgi:hypothetical protein